MTNPVDKKSDESSDNARNEHPRPGSGVGPTDVMDHTPNANAEKLSDAMERFILHWGDLGPNWGVPRSVAQVHALLFVADRPMNALEIAETLSIARSNAHAAVKELLTWGLIQKAPAPGDRRDRYVAEGDVWEMATRIAEIRKAREIDPATAILKTCLADAKNDPNANAQAVQRLDALLDLLDVSNNWFEQMRRVPRARLLPLIKLGARAVDLLSPFLGRKSAHESDHQTDAENPAQDLEKKT